jgi:hypothetical protein
MGFLRGGNGNDARVSSSTGDSPDEPYFVPIFEAFREIPSVLVADLPQADPKRHSIEFKTSGLVRPEAEVVLRVERA